MQHRYFSEFISYFVKSCFVASHTPPLGKGVKNFRGVFDKFWGCKIPLMGAQLIPSEAADLQDTILNSTTFSPLSHWSVLRIHSRQAELKSGHRCPPASYGFESVIGWNCGSYFKYLNSASQEVEVIV